MNLINDDCMNILPDYADDYFDLAIVDPPYGIKEDGKSNHSRGLLAETTKFTPKDWDKNSPDKSYFDELLRVSVGTAPVPAKVTKVTSDNVEIEFRRPVCIFAKGSVALSRRIAERWRLIGAGVID